MNEITILMYIVLLYGQYRFSAYRQLTR